MPLPTLPKKQPRPVAVMVRLSKTSAGQLRKLAEAHNMSQADVLEILLEQEWRNYESRRQGKK